MRSVIVWQWRAFIGVCNTRVWIERGRGEKVDFSLQMNPYIKMYSIKIIDPIILSSQHYYKQIQSFDTLAIEEPHSSALIGRKGELCHLPVGAAWHADSSKGTFYGFKRQESLRRTLPKALRNRNQADQARCEGQCSPAVTTNSQKLWNPEQVNVVVAANLQGLLSQFSKMS